MVDALDGGYGWVVVLGSFIVHMLVLGIQYSFGVTFVALLDDFDSTRDEVAWVGSLSVGFQCGMGVVSGWLVARFGERRVLFAGGLLASCALILASFCEEIYQLYLTYGVLLGLAFSWLQPPAIMVVQRWFVKRRALASAVGSSGSGVGTMVLGPAVAAIIKAMGWRTAFRYIAILPILLASIAAVLCRSPEVNKDAPRQSSSKTVPYWFASEQAPLLRNRSLLLLMVSVCVAGLGWFVPVVHIVQYGKDIGVSEAERSMLVTALGIGLLIGRVPTCWVADRCGRFRVFAADTALIGVATCLLTLADSFITLFPICVLFGWAAGSFVALTPPVVKEFMSQEEFAQATGLVYTAWGWSLMIGPPVVGVLYRVPEKHSYTMPFLVAGSITILGSMLILVAELSVKVAASQKGAQDISYPNRQESVPEASSPDRA